MSLLKQNRITCPHCKAPFEVGADIEAITKGATNLFKSLSDFLGEKDDDEDDENEFSDACMSIAENFDVSPSAAREMLEKALKDEHIIDTILDFLDEYEV